jgi:hypothetical protein
LTIIIDPAGFLGFREMRSRREYQIPILTAYRMAIEAERNAEKKRQTRIKSKS